MSNCPVVSRQRAVDLIESRDEPGAACGQARRESFRPFTAFNHFLKDSINLLEGTRWRSWLRHCVTSRKVAGSISDGVTGIFQWLKPSGRIVALGSTQPLTEMSTKNPSWGWRRTVHRADNLTTFMCRFV
jgi:hypothetical protein